MLGRARGRVAGWGLARRAVAVAPAGARTTGRDILQSASRATFLTMLPSVLSLSCSAAAWDTVEELSAAASHAKASGSGDPLEDVSGALAGTSSSSSQGSAWIGLPGVARAGSLWSPVQGT